MSKGLNELRDIAHNHAKSHGFDDMNVGTQLMLIVTEVSEAMEDYRKGHSPKVWWYEKPDGTNAIMGVDFQDVKGDAPLLPPPGKPCGIPSEIADVIIRCLDFCGRFGIPIEDIVEEKIAYNATRPHKHGKQV